MWINWTYLVGSAVCALVLMLPSWGIKVGMVDIIVMFLFGNWLVWLWIKFLIEVVQCNCLCSKLEKSFCPLYAVWVTSNQIIINLQEIFLYVPTFPPIFTFINICKFTLKIDLLKMDNLIFFCGTTLVWIFFCILLSQVINNQTWHKELLGCQQLYRNER